MKKILIPISFSATSANSLRHAFEVDPTAQLTLLHCYPVQSYSRRYDFGSQNYDAGIRKKLNAFYDRHLEQASGKPIFLSEAGTVSEVVRQISGRYDLMVMSRKAHPDKGKNYFSEKQLFLIARALCPVLIMPVTGRPFQFEHCEHIWHIERRANEGEIVAKGMAGLGIAAGRIETKSLTQGSFLSDFWKNLMAYENTHDQKLLSAIDQAHETEPIDLIVLVDHEQSIFINFLKSDTIRVLCKYEIPILALPANAGKRK